jgi:membrane-associated phospholipid phosphatase
MAADSPIVAAAVALAVVLHAPAAAAQEAPDGSASVYRVNLAIDIPIIAAGAIGTAVPYLTSSTIVTPSCPCNRDQLNFFDRGSVGNHSPVFSTIGDVTVALAVAAPLVVALVDVRPMKTLIEDLTIYTEAMAVNAGLTALAKFTVQRPTPKAYAGDPALIDKPGGYLSFYSGHTSFAFAALGFGAVTAGLRHGQHLLPWVTTVAVGTGVAASMVLGGAHFPTDVAMGALAGTVVGVAVPLLHRRGPRGLHLSLRPEPDGKRILALRGRF